MNRHADILVIGAGIAGCSVAAELAADARVILLEKETQPGHHATGRSAAFYDSNYGNAVVRGLTAASEPFFRGPPVDFTDTALLRPRDFLSIARKEQLPQLQAELEGNPALEWMSGPAAVEALPLLSPDYVAAALRNRLGGDLDVDAILQGYIRRFRQRGGRLQAATEVSGLQWRGGCWQVQTDGDDYRAPIVVNAAGAWADAIAGLAGLGALGIVPMRRTAVLIDVPAGQDGSDWPMVADVGESFYIKPDAGQLLISPADETPGPACDAQAQEMDIALAVHRYEEATASQVRRINHHWAGLRSFAPDKTFVVGFDPRATGFFWLAGQGGYGVQSSPAMAQLASSLVNGAAPGTSFAGVMDYADAVAPDRLIS